MHLRAGRVILAVLTLAPLPCCGGGGGQGAVAPPPPAVVVEFFEGVTDGLGRVALPSGLSARTLQVLDQQTLLPVAGANVSVAGDGSAVMVDVSTRDGVYVPVLATIPATASATARRGASRAAVIDFDTIYLVRSLLHESAGWLAGGQQYPDGIAATPDAPPNLLRAWLERNFVFEGTTTLGNLGPGLVPSIQQFILDKTTEVGIRAIVPNLVASGLAVPEVTLAVLAITALATLPQQVEDMQTGLYALAYESLCFPPSATMEIWARRDGRGLPLIVVLHRDPVPPAPPIETSIAIEGTVRDQVTGAPLSGVSVHVLSAPGVFAGAGEGMTDALGRYEIRHREAVTGLLSLVPGYLPLCSSLASTALVAQKAGYDPTVLQAGSLDLALGRTNILNLTMVPHCLTGCRAARDYVGSIEVASGPGATAMLAKDLDLDGDPDLLVACGPTHEIRVRLAHGPGYEGAEVRVPVGGAPLALAAGDFDGDVLPDLAVAVEGSPEIRLFHGDGQGGFSPLTSTFLPVGGEAADLHLVDMNADFKKDLVIADRSRNRVVVKLGSGGGAFPNDAAYPSHERDVGDRPVALAVEDLDGDHAPDVVSANELGNTITLLRGMNGGDLAVLTTVPSGRSTFGGPLHVTVGDLDDDGLPDLLVTNAGSSSLSVFRQLPGVTPFAFEAVTDHLVPEASPAVIEDFDRDGFADVAMLRSTASMLVVWYMSGDLLTLDERTFPTGLAPAVLQAAHVNGDGRMDLLTANRGTDSVSVLFNAQGRRFDVRRDFLTRPDDVADQPYDLVIADLDDLAGKDIAVVHQTGNAVSVYTNVGGTGVLSLTQRLDTATQPVGIAARDVTGDGHVDLVVPCFSSQVVRVFVGNGQGTFTYLTDVATGAQPMRVAIQDLDDMGKNEIVVMCYFPARLLAFRQSDEDPLRFDVAATYAGGDFGLSHDMSMGRIDPDRWEDLAITNYFSDSVTVILADRQGGWLPGITLTGITNPISVAILDVDGDDWGDVVVAGGSNGKIFYGDPAMSFTRTSAFDSGHWGYNNGRISGEDLDDDGSLDLVIPDTSVYGGPDRPGRRAIAVLYGDGLGGFPRRTGYGVGAGAHAVAIGKLDANASWDLVSANIGIGTTPLPRTISVLLHR